MVRSKSLFALQRPLANLYVETDVLRYCQLECYSGMTSNLLPVCRGAHSRDSEPIKIGLRVYNEGPGAMYNLSFLRRQVFLDEPDGVPPGKTGNASNEALFKRGRYFKSSPTFDSIDKLTEDLTVADSMKVIDAFAKDRIGASGTGNSFKEKEVLLPGESLVIHDHISNKFCEEALHDPNFHSQVFFSYDVSNFAVQDTNKSPFSSALPDNSISSNDGICVDSSSGEAKQSNDKPVYCNSVTKKCSSGECKFATMEPKRIFKPVMTIEPQSGTTRYKVGKGLGGYIVAVDRWSPALGLVTY